MFTSSNLQHSFGLDIGDLALRFVFLQKKGDYFKIKCYGEKLLPPGLTSEGKINKPDELAAHLANLIEHPDCGKLNLKNVVTCLPETKTFIKLITVPWPKDHDLTNSIINEAQKHIPLSLDEAYLDWQIVDSQEKEWLKILLGVTPQDIANNYIKLLKLVGLKPTVLEVEAAAIVRSLLLGGEAPPKESFIILDLGATRSSIIIYAKNTIQFSLTVPISGVQITQMLAAKINCSYEKAEELKVSCGLQVKGENTSEVQISATLNEIINPLIVKIKDALEFYKLHFPRATMPSKIILTGGGSQFLGLGRLLKTTFGLEIEVANPYINIKNNIPSKHPSSYATALGLAMRGCQPEKFYDFT